MSSAYEVAFVDAVNGTNLNARATAGAEVVVDSGEVILNGDSAVRTGLLTLHTADTAVGAVLTCESALVLVGTFNNHAGGVVDKVDNTVGTLAHTNAATDTLAGINFGNAVIYRDSALRTNRCAVAVAEAGEGTVLIAAVRHVCGKTGIVALVVALSGSGVTGTVAGNEGYLLNNVLCLNAEDVCNALCGAVAAGNTEVGLVGGLFCKSLGISVTSGVAASATVSAGKTVTDGNGGFIFLDREEYAGQGKKRRTNYSDCYENEGRNKNSHHIATPFFMREGFPPRLQIRRMQEQRWMPLRE